jgi:stress response protein SCP2
MRKMHFVAAAAVLAFSAGVAVAAPAVSSVGFAVKAHPVQTSSLAAVLYDQTDSDAASGINSQNFEAAYDVYDNQGADDFTVPSGVKWKVSEVDVTGSYYNGSGLAASQHVTFYKDKNGKPGKIVAEFDNVTGSDDGFGSLAIKLPSTVTLKTGTYWVSVQVNMDYSQGGQWAWGNRSTVNGSNAMWQNPGDGFGSGCVKYADESTCTGSGLGDKLFSLRGKVKAIAQ